MLRVLAILTMLLAVTQGGLVFCHALADLSGRGEELRSDLQPTLSYGSRMEEVTARLHQPALLFCAGAALFVLIRIARAQDDDGPVADSQARESRQPQGGG
jgi:hypothetical protein